jgi:hypothetical protein
VTSGQLAALAAQKIRIKAVRPVFPSFDREAAPTAMAVSREEQ